MNDRQRTLLAIAGALVFLMLAFPPFVVSLPNGASINKGYDFIFSPPKHGVFTASVNVGTLFAQWAAIAILAVVGWVLLKGRVPMPNSSNTSANNSPFGGASTQKPGGGGQTKVLRAGFWKRVAAYLLDYVILFVAIFLFFAIAGLMGIISPDAAESSSTGIGMLAFWLYFALQESGQHQATIGKRTLAIKVVTLAGKAPSFWRATGRHFAKILSGLLLCIGYLMCIFTAKKQCLHDIMADCLVVRDDATEQEIATAIGQLAP
jgi:uncharacterized RDD family membrane protein YckC